MSQVVNWRSSQLPDLTGKKYFITGANAGLGFEAAKMLRRNNATVYLGCRNEARGMTAVNQIGDEQGSGDVRLVQIDLADTQSIRDAAAELHTLTDLLDGVINNAGIMQPPQSTTVDGFELQFGTNHLGHFLLNYLIFDQIVAANGRVVPVASIAHKVSSGIQFDDPMFGQKYNATKAYAQSKLANLMYGLELARRLEAAGSSVMSVIAHPGYSDTNLQSTGPTGLLKRIYSVSNKLVAIPAQAGAKAEVLAVAGVEAQNGAYYGPTQFGGARGPIGDSAIAKQALDRTNAQRLWKLSEELLDIEWDIERATTTN